MHRTLRRSSPVSASSSAQALQPAAAVLRPKPQSSTEQKIPVRTSTVETRDLTETLTLTGSLEPRATGAGGCGSCSPADARPQRRRRSRRAGRRDRGARRHRSPAGSRPREGHARRGRGEPCARQGRRGTRRKPPEDRRHHRQGSPVRAGGRSGGRGVRTRRRAPSWRLPNSSSRARRSGRRCRANRRSARPMRERCSRSGARSSRSWTMRVFEFRASVASSDLAKVRVGEAVTVTVDALPGFSAKGQVTRIVPLVDPRSRSFDVVVRIPGQRAARLRPVRPGGHSRARRAGQPDRAPGGARPRRSRSHAGPGICRDRRQGRATRRHRGRRAARCRAGDERPAGRRGRGGRSACGAWSRHAVEVQAATATTAQVHELRRIIIMFLSNLSIKQPVFATMMMVALAVLGLNSYRALQVDLFPEVEFPVVTVTTRYAGASPETVERDVTKTVEEAVNTVEGRASHRVDLPGRPLEHRRPVQHRRADAERLAGHPRQGGRDPGRSPARHRRADHPAHRSERDADRVGGHQRAGADAAGRLRHRRQAGQAPARECSPASAR